MLYVDGRVACCGVDATSDQGSREGESVFKSMK
jgi:hypothetical protein